MHRAFGETKINSVLLAFGIAIIMGLVFYLLPISHDYYGDAPRTLKGWAEEGNDLFPERYATVFNPNIFNAQNGELTVLNGMEWLIKTGHMDASRAFTWMDLVCGGLYIFLMTYFVLDRVKGLLLRIVLLIPVLTAPMLLNFMGRVEVYAPSLVTIPAFLIAADQTVRKRSAIWLGITFLCLFLALKMHSIAFLLVPAFFLIAVWVILKDEKKRQRWFNWKTLSLVVLLPVFIAGVLVYFFVFEDHRDPRFFEEGIEPIDRLFLPVFSPDPPLDKYNLFGFNHLFDYSNNLLMLSSSAIFLFFALFITHRSTTDWNKPEVLFTGLTLILFLGLLFAINPLLGMPMDWDLFSLPGPILLIWVVQLFSNRKVPIRSELFIGPAVGLGLLSFSFLVINSSPDTLSRRLESISIHTFRTYYDKAYRPAFYALELKKNDPSATKEIAGRVAKKMKLTAQSGDDWVCAETMRRYGKYFRKEEKNYSLAVRYHEEAASFDPEKLVNQEGLMEAYYLNGQFREAFTTAQKLAEKEHPTKKKSLRYVIDLGLEFGYFRETEPYVKLYTETWPMNSRMQYIHQCLCDDVNLSMLSNVFRGGPIPAQR